jgi:hypothetical protein
MVKWLNGGTARSSEFVASNVSSIICFWSKRPLAIGDALAGSHDGQRPWLRGNARGHLDGMRAEKMRADSHQAATEKERVCVASNVSSIIYFWSRRPLAIGDALAGSHDGQRSWSRGNTKGDWMACAQKKSEPTHIRLLRRNEVFEASNVSSIIYFWSRLPLAIGDAFGGSHDGQRPWSRGNAKGDWMACAQKK